MTTDNERLTLAGTDGLPLAVATGNPGKVRELRALLAPLGFSLTMFSGEIEETGTTYEENALIKAWFAVEKTGHAAVADDSGLEVFALDGAPGVHSARAAPNGAFCPYLLERMHGLSDRRARFVSCIALCFPGGRTILAHGVCEGEITREARGNGGFGYDPIFLFPELGKTMAEIPATLKNRISHRAKAMQNLVKQIGNAR